MTNINEYLSYIEASDTPLSAEVYFIKGKKQTYIFDVGANCSNIDVINRQNNPVVILSHFHNDHIGNWREVEVNTFYLSSQTYKYLHKGKIIENELDIEDGIVLQIIPLVNSHAKGSLCVNINEEYLLVGDGIYPTERNGTAVYNAQQLQQTITTLKKIKAHYVICSHENAVLNSKEKIIDDLEKIYLRKEKNNPYIVIESE